MNREIKFRVWDNHYKYMNYKVIVGVYGNWEDVKNDKNYTACSMWIEPEKVDYKCDPHWTHFEPYHEDIKLMQYTGLKDKNGVEIYEGDIVKKETFDDTKPSFTKTSYAKVMWIEELAGFYLVNKGNKILWELAQDKYNIEVASTIYDNPELLEKEV